MDDDQEHEHPVRNLVLSVCDLKQHGDVPSARCGAQTVTMATRTYLHGGCDEKQVHGSLHLLEIEQMKWTELQPEGRVPSARWAHTMEAHGTDLVLFGGLTSEGDGALLSDEAPAAPRPPPFAPALQWGHTGIPDGGLYILRSQSLQWEQPQCAGTAPSARFLHSACVAGDRYIVFGGCSSANYGNALGDVHWLDLQNMQWSSPSCSGEAPSARYSHKMIPGTGDQVFVFGGGGAGSVEAHPGILHGLDLSTNVWSVVQVSGTAPLERSFHSFDLIGKWGFVFAGSATNGLSDLYILDVPNMRWARPLYEGQVNVRAHAASVMHDKLIVFGGVRDKITPATKKGQADICEPRISRKLFFLNVLEVKGGASASEGDFKFKLVTVGDSGVGKSCLLTRFVSDFYSDFHVSTIGVDFKTVLTMVKGRLVKLQLWDTAGQERFSVVTGNYYRNSDGFIFVYDATSRSSFEHVDQWLGQVQQHHECGPTTIKILIGNKSDMVGELVVTEEEGRAKAESIGAMFVATSAKTASNVDMAFLSAAQSLVETRIKQRQQPNSMGSGGGSGGTGGGGGVTLGGGGGLKAPGSGNKDRPGNKCAGAGCGK